MILLFKKKKKWLKLIKFLIKKNFSLKNNGHILSLSFSSGIFPNINLLELHRRNATATGVWLGGYEQTDIINAINMIFDMFDNGYLQGLKINHFSLENIQECINAMKTSNFFGKAVINMH